MSELQIAEKVDPATRLVSIPDYALHSISDAFTNFHEVMGPYLANEAGAAPYDVTAFYSRRRQLSPEEEQALKHSNAMATKAAWEIGGLLTYFQGDRLEDAQGVPSPELGLDFTPDCLSFCIWESRKQALAGASLPEHVAASRQARKWYERFSIIKYDLIIAAGQLALQRL